MISTIALSWIFVEIKDSVLTKVFSEIAIQLWSEWELRLMVIVSLCLLYCGRKRQNYQGKHLAGVSISAWITYQSATAVANLVLTSLLKGDPKLINGLVVLWSPFALWHLGSPHNITAYSLEDNDMWLRQFFGLVTQVGQAVSIQIKFRSSSTLNFLAVPIFISGVFKAGERIWALRCASEKQLINSISILSHEVKASQQMVKPAWKDKEVRNIRKAYLSFMIFKPLFTDHPCRIKEKDYDGVVDLKSESVEEAFALVGIELSFLYDLFFTKLPIHYQGSKVSLGLHGFCFLSVVSSLVCFSTTIVDKSKFSRVEVSITYMLLMGAIVVDICLFINHALSKWTIAQLGSLPPKSKLYSMLVACTLNSSNSKRSIRKVAQQDLISYYADATESKFIKVIRLIDTSNLLQKHKYTVWESVDSDLKTFIYDDPLKKRDEYRDLIGESEETQDSLLSSLLEKAMDGVLKSFVGDKYDEDDWDNDRKDFARCIFVWHIATNLVYYDDLYKHRRGMLSSYCKISKTLSDYMAYLVLLRPTMMPKGFGDLINRKNDNFVEKLMLDRKSQNSSVLKKIIVECLISYKVQDTTTSSAFGLESQQHILVVPKACAIAQSLQRLVSECRWDHERKWEMISKLWMSIMTYAANHCSWKDHAQQLRHGGELLTHVALLMAHLGLGTKIQICEEEDQSELPIPNF